jgi:hypothetical protein
MRVSLLLVALNLTVACATLSAPTQMPSDLMFERSCRDVIPLQDGGCKCVNRHHQIRCCCANAEDIRKIPQHLPTQLSALFLYNIGIAELGESSFTNYHQLEEL